MNFDFLTVSKANEMRIERALISVFDKSHIVFFAERLSALGVEIISTGGTARVLKGAGIGVHDISLEKDSGVMMNGRLKTLQPKIHGGLLFVQGNPEHEASLKKHKIKPIDLLVVNLYPFEKVVAKPNVDLDEAIENIDIGGVAMIRSGAKNHKRVVVVTDPNDYDEVAKKIESGGNHEEWRRKLAIKAFTRTTNYDKAIMEYFADLQSLHFASLR